MTTIPELRLMKGGEYKEDDNLVVMTPWAILQEGKDSLEQSN